MKKWRKSEKGIGLLELMLAIAIFVIGAATVAHLYIGAQTSANYSADKTQALLLAREGIETARAIRDVDFSDLVDWAGLDGTVTLDGKDFNRTASASCDGEVCTATSTVGWTFAGRAEEVSFTEHLTAWMVLPLDVDTSSATEIATSSATLNGELTSLGIYDSADVYFQWREVGAADWTPTTPPQTKIATGAFSEGITGLVSGTTYEFRAAAVADTETVYGTTLTFTTPAE